MKYKLIDLFSGCGGMTLGFVDPNYCDGFDVVFAIDNNQSAIDSYILNFGNHAVCDDIQNILSVGCLNIIPKADVVIGGPPCQGFSLLNKNRKDDDRRSLWEHFMDVVEHCGASIFVIENVQGLLKSSELNSIEVRAEKIGFGTISALLNAADYGAPQIRKRAFVVGWKKTKINGIEFPPNPTHSNSTCAYSLPKWRTVRTAISDLPVPEGSHIRNISPPLDLHFGRNPTKISMQRYEAVPPGGNRFDLQRNAPEITPPCWIKKKSGGTDLFGRLWWDRPSVTIRTEFFKPEKGRYLHPDQNRPITHREAARLMGFPDSFHFVGTKIEIAKQIGNAVPPDMACEVAKAVYEALSCNFKEREVA